MLDQSNIAPCVRTLIIVVVALSLRLTPAYAEPWERLPDRRVVIEIKGHRIALPSEGEEIKNFSFMPETLDQRMNLPEVIAEPERARRLFAEAKSITIRLPNLPEQQGSFLNRFERYKSGFVPYTFGISIGAGVQGSCQAWSRIFNRYRETILAEGRPTDENGWVEFIEGRSPEQWVYVRREPDPSLPRHFDSIVCGYFGGCGAGSCIGEDMSIGYSFAREHLPREVWPEVVRKAAEVLRHIIIDDQGLRGHQ